jgi:branched-chain amino acid transport system permease protein
MGYCLNVPSSPATTLLRSRIGVAIACVLVAGVFALPFALTDYRVFQATLVIVDAIALLGLNLLTGYGGQISLGHGAFYGIGAYTAAILVHRFGVAYWLTIPCAACLCFVVGFLFGLPALRLEGLYLALATFALGVVVPQLFKFRGTESYTGGVQGITIPKPQPPFGLPLTADQWLYFFALGVAVLFFAAAYNLVRSPTGRAIVAIRDHSIAAASVGVDVAAYKTTTFGVSAMFTGAAGALSALAVQFVGPDSFSIFLSIGLLVGIVVGGLASLSGAVYGAIFLQIVPDLAGDVSKAAPGAVYGAVLLLCVYVMPTGVAGLVRSIARQYARSHETAHGKSNLEEES